MKEIIPLVKLGYIYICAASHCGLSRFKEKKCKSLSLWKCQHYFVRIYGIRYILWLSFKYTLWHSGHGYAEGMCLRHSKKTVKRLLILTRYQIIKKD